MKNFPSNLQHGSGTMMTLDATRLLLAFRESQTREDLIPLLRQLGLTLENANQEENRTSLEENVNHTDRRFWITTLSGNAIDDELFNALEETFGDALEVIHPVYRLANMEGRGGLLCPLSNVLVIKLNPQPVPGIQDVTSAVLQLAATGERPVLRENPEKSKYLGGYRYYLIDNPKENSAYQLKQLLLERGKQLVQDVRFENMPMLVPTTVTPGDPLFAQQWDMTQIHAPEGWDISTGTSAVVVCVLDQGCDLTHPDLQFSTPGINPG